MPYGKDPEVSGGYGKDPVSGGYGEDWFSKPQDVTTPARREPKEEKIPRTGLRGQIRAAEERPFERIKPATAEELAGQWQEVGKGAVSGTLGTPGDIEYLGRLLGRAVRLPISKETFIPTTEDVEKILDYAPPATPEEAKSRKVGQFLGGVFGPSVVSKPFRYAAESKLVGRPGVTQAELAAQAEREGLKVRAPQARYEDPIGMPLSRENQVQVNKAISDITGKESSTVDPKFIKNRMEDLGKKYDKAYSGQIQIDKNIADSMKEIADFEKAIDPAGSAQILKTAENLSARWDRAYMEAVAQATQQQLLKTMSQQRRQMGRGIGDVIDYTFKPGERIDAAPLTREILESYGTRPTNVRLLTAEDAPVWAKDVNSVITELTEKLGLRVRPGVYVGRGGDAYGWAHPYGHIFLNEDLLKSGKDAIATAIHEFGHHAEFQLFNHAAPEVKTAIGNAWREHMAASVGKTIEQYRPVTAEKYAPESRGRVPQTAEELKYFAGFPEWFAEQTSRWITTAKQPITVVEKFFKGIADMWKAIYQRVTGYVPLADDVKKFMEANWEGKAINETVVQKILKAPEGAAPGTIVDPTVVAVTKPIKPVGPVIAKIDGNEFQALRNKIAKTARDGDKLNRPRARELLRQLDDAMANTNPEIAAQLKKINQQYRATMALRELELSGDPSILRGQVNPQALGKMIAQEGSAITHPLAKYGQYGTGLGMRSAAAGAEAQADIIKALVSGATRLGKALTTPIISTPSDIARRAIQRRMTPVEQPRQPKFRTTAAGLAGKATQDQEKK